MNIMEKLKAKPWDNTTRDLGNVYVNKGQVLEIPETVDLYTEAELRQVLGVTRLPKRAVHNVPCAAIPSREDPSQYTTVYAFRQKEDNVIPRVGVLKTFLGVERTRSVAPSSGLQWDGHADVVFRGAVANQFRDHYDLYKTSRTIGVWMESVQAKPAKAETHEDRDEFDGAAAQTTLMTSPRRNTSVTHLLTASPPATARSMSIGSPAQSTDDNKSAHSAKGCASVISFGAQTLANAEDQLGPFA